MSRCDSAAIGPDTSELLPEPETPVKTVRRRLGSSTLTSLGLLTRAPCTRMRSWLSAWCCPSIAGTLGLDGAPEQEHGAPRPALDGRLERHVGGVRDRLPPRPPE